MATIPRRPLATFAKYAVEKRAYAIEWSLPAGVTIASAVWSISFGGEGTLDPSPAGHPSTVVGTTTVVWLTDGTPGGQYRVMCVATTSEGEELAAEIAIAVQ